MNDSIDLLSTARAAAETAAGPLIEAKSSYKKVHLEEAHDVKLQADIESEKLIRTYLNKNSNFPIIGEEEGGDASLWSSDKYYWVVDPLDGTFNYLKGIPQCCVSIGLMKGQEAILGVVYDFNRDDWFTGGENLPFELNGNIVNPLWAESIEKACITTGFPHEMKRDPNSMNDFLRIVLKYKKLRMIGTAALASTYVCTGYFDVYYETGIKLWDIAAALAFAKSVGAKVEIKEWHDKPLYFDAWISGKEEFIVR